MMMQNTSSEQENDRLLKLRRSGREVWLAGLNVLIGVGEESAKYFQSLLQHGPSVEQQYGQFTESLERLGKGVNQFAVKANSAMDVVDGILEEQTAFVFSKLGMPATGPVNALKSMQDLRHKAMSMVGVSAEGEPEVIKKRSRKKRTTKRQTKKKTIGDSD